MLLTFLISILGNKDRRGSSITTGVEEETEEREEKTLMEREEKAEEEETEETGTITENKESQEK